MIQTGAEFADAAVEWLRYVEQDRRRRAGLIQVPEAAGAFAFSH
jgi:hypothetical protein